MKVVIKLETVITEGSENVIIVYNADTIKENAQALQMKLSLDYAGTQLVEAANYGCFGRCSNH